MISSILGAIKTLGSIFKYAKGAYTLWQESRREKREDEIRESISDSIKKGDQRDFEKAIGSSNAGKPTKHRLDGLQKRPRKNRSGKLAD